MRRLRLGSDSGGALPMVLLMVVLLSLLLTATAALTRSSAATVNAAATEQRVREDAVTWAMQRALQDLSPSFGQVLGVDPSIDPGGSCVGQLGPYTTPGGNRVRVDCTEAPNSGVRTGMSSLMLVGDGSDCAAGESCETGRDGGLRLTSNAPLNFSGTLINLAGAWLGKNPNAELLNAVSARSAVIQPGSASTCPASSAGFDGSVACSCPNFGSGTAPCNYRAFDGLRSDVDAYLDRVSTALRSQSVSASAVIPTCSSSARLDPADAESPWAIVLTGGVVGASELVELNALTDGKPCIGDGSTKQEPLLVINGILRFGGTGSAMAPNTAPSVLNTWVINKPTATVVMGKPQRDPVTGSVQNCTPEQPGGMLQFSGSTYVRVLTGRMLLCPLKKDGVVLAAPDNRGDAGFRWAGIATEPLLSTQYGLASGEVIRAQGLIFAPSAFFRIDAQSNRTAIALNGGTVLRGLTLTSNPSTITQGDFTATAPDPSGTRDVQLRFWDLDRNRDLGLVQILIKGEYPTNPAAAFVIKLWRTMW